jgi:hypothetical protein
MTEAERAAAWQEYLEFVIEPTVEEILVIEEARWALAEKYRQRQQQKDSKR